MIKNTYILYNPKKAPTVKSGSTYKYPSNENIKESTVVVKVVFRIKDVTDDKVFVSYDTADDDRSYVKIHTKEEAREVYRGLLNAGYEIRKPPKKLTNNELKVKLMDINLKVKQLSNL
ncbi:hypothetical protein AB4428_19695 [Vibrio lentus]